MRRVRRHRHVYTRLVCRDGKCRADASSAASVARALVPYNFFRDLVLRRLQPRAATCQNMRARCGEVYVRRTIRHAICGAVIARRTADRDSEESGILEGLIEGGQRLRGPRRLRPSPTDRYYRGLAYRVVHRSRDGIEKALIGVRREVDRYFDTGAMAPTTSISSSTSPSALFGSPTG